MVPGAYVRPITGRSGRMLPSGGVATGTFGLRSFEQPAFRRIVIVMLLAIIGLFRALQLWMLSYDRLWAFDFSYYWTAAGHLLRGEPLYSATQLAGTYIPEDQVGFLYPPPLAVVITPLAALFPTDYKAAGWVWAAIGAAILVLSVLAIVRSERLVERFEPALGWGPNVGQAAFVIAAFAMTPVIAELSVGNVHLELLGLFTLAWLGIRRGDARGERIAGAAIAVAALIKVFPALLLLWFVATGRRHAAVWTVLVAAVIAVVLVPTTGLQSWLDYPRVLMNMGPILDLHDSVSPTLWLEPVVGFQLARTIIVAAAINGVVWVARSHPDILSYPIAVTASILIAPAVFHHYLSILVLPLALALAAGVRWWLVGLIYILLWGGQQPALGDWAWVLSRVPQTVAYLLLIGALVAARKGRQQAALPTDLPEVELHDVLATFETSGPVPT
jgi:hypothetical protein